MTTHELLDLLITRLTGAAGRSRGHWRRVLGQVKVYPIATHPTCNWSIEPTGAIADVEIAQDTLDVIRLEHTLVEA